MELGAAELAPYLYGVPATLLLVAGTAHLLTLRRLRGMLRAHAVLPPGVIPAVPAGLALSEILLGAGGVRALLGDSAVMVAAARALLGGNNPGADITKRIGIDDIKIGRADSTVLGVLPQSTVAGRTGTASAADVVTVGKRINRELYLSYEQGLADAEGTLKLAWRLTRQFHLLARAGYLPGLDAVYRWSFP